MEKLPEYKDYAEFCKLVSFGQLDDVDVTHDGYPLTAKESKFISLFIANGNIHKTLKEAGLTIADITGKEYIADEITYQLDKIKKASVADADEIMQYLTKVMRGQEKDQFGLDAPLSERTAAARELAKRIVDVPDTETLVAPKLQINLNWDNL